MRGYHGHKSDARLKGLASHPHFGGVTVPALVPCHNTLQHEMTEQKPAQLQHVVRAPTPLVVPTLFSVPLHPVRFLAGSAAVQDRATAPTIVFARYFRNRFDAVAPGALAKRQHMLKTRVIVVVQRSASLDPFFARPFRQVYNVDQRAHALQGGGLLFGWRHARRKNKKRVKIYRKNPAFFQNTENIKIKCISNFFESTV